MDTNQPIKAFEGFDSSVFLSWLEGLGDIMANSGNCPRESIANMGGMVMALSRAARELQARELAEVGGFESSGLVSTVPAKSGPGPRLPLTIVPVD